MKKLVIVATAAIVALSLSVSAFAGNETQTNTAFDGIFPIAFLAVKLPCDNIIVHNPLEDALTGFR